MIKNFAERYRLKLTKDGSGEDMEFVILGKIGQSSIYEYSPNELGAAVITDGKKPPRTGWWNNFKAACLEVGMKPRQVGDAEGSFSFDPGNKAQAKVAIKGIRARAKRQISPEQAAANVARLAAARESKISTQNPRQEHSVSL
jgi:hypothetical protein